MNDNIDITKISIRRLIKLSIKDHDRGVENWNEPLVIRGLYVISVSHCYHILRSKITNKYLSRQCALARKGMKIIRVKISLVNHFNCEMIEPTWLSKISEDFLNKQLVETQKRLNKLLQAKSECFANSSIHLRKNYYE